VKRAWGWLPAVLAVLLMVGAGVAGLGVRYLRGTHFPAGSSYRSDDRGLRALYLLLEETGHRPRRLTRAQPPPGVLLVVAEPPKAPSPDRDAALVEWVARGGELLFVMPREEAAAEGRTPPSPQPEAGQDAAATTEKAVAKPTLAERLGLRAVSGDIWGGPMEDSPFYRLDLGEELALRYFTYWPRDARVLLGGPDAPVALETRLGEGRVTALADPSLLENEGVAEGDHLFVALALTAGRGRPVVFDEFGHGVGERAGLAYVLARYGLLPTAFAALAFLGLLAWRTGSPEAPRQDGPAAPFEVRDSLVEARALLYSHALRPKEAVELVERDLRRHAATLLGAKRLLSWEELDDRVRERKPKLLGRLRALRNQTQSHLARPPARLDDVLPYAKMAAHLLEEMQ
jgi:hypothetical protein